MIWKKIFEMSKIDKGLIYRITLFNRICYKDGNVLGLCWLLVTCSYRVFEM